MKFAINSEDLALLIGSTIALFQTGFDIHSAVFSLSIGGVLKAVLGCFGVTINPPKP